MIVDILLKQYDGERERTRVYHNIDPNSLVVQGKSVYFARPDCWLSGNCANRYRIEIGGMDYLSSDPEDIERAMQDIPELNRGLFVSGRDRDLNEALCEAVGGPVEPEDGDGE